MAEKVKLIWDFHGPDGKKTAEHHVIHLVEYLNHKNLEYIAVDVDVLDENRTIAFVIIAKTHMIQVRDDLKPHRGEYA